MASLLVNYSAFMAFLKAPPRCREVKTGRGGGALTPMHPTPLQGVRGEGSLKVPIIGRNAGNKDGCQRTKRRHIRFKLTTVTTCRHGDDME